MHELGHVDHLHRGLRSPAAGVAVDMEAAELHAHEFACRRLIDGSFRNALSLYLHRMIEQLAESPAQGIARAAARFKASPLYQEGRAFLAPPRTPSPSSPAGS